MLTTSAGGGISSLLRGWWWTFVDVWIPLLGYYAAALGRFLVPLGSAVALVLVGPQAPSDRGWGLDVFAGAGAMAGFMLAALALVLAALPSRVMASLEKTEALDKMLHALIASMAAWLVAALGGLVNWIFEPPSGFTVEVVLLSLGAGEALHATFWVFATVRRFFSGPTE